MANTISMNMTIIKVYAHYPLTNKAYDILVKLHPIVLTSEAITSNCKHMEVD